MFTMGPPLWGGETDPYFSSVILLMHFDGDYTDKSSLAQAFTNTGATVSATGAKFTQSVATNGTNPGGGGGNNVKSNSSRAEYDLNTSDFTIECWLNPSSTANSGVNPAVSLAIAGTAVGMSIGIERSNSQTAARLSFQTGAGMDAITSTAAGVYLATGTWYHIAATRSTNTYRLFVNGVLVSSVNDATRGSVVSRKATIGNHDGLTSGFHGLVDEARVTKGFARYTASFTPPAAPFPDA